jgi:hypothetical protein
MTSERMPIAVKKSPRPHDAFVTYVNHLVTCLTGNPSFTDPTPSVASLAAQASAMAQANARARGGGPGVVADRNARRAQLEGDIDHLVDHVRGVIRTQAVDPATATAMILSAGLSIRKSGKAPKPPLAAKHGSVSGEVKLMALAVAHTAMYFWEYSLDQLTWTSLPSTLRCKTTVADLVPGQLYFFRFRAHTWKGLGDVSDAVKCRVL